MQFPRPPSNRTQLTRDGLEEYIFIELPGCTLPRLFLEVTVTSFVLVTPLIMQKDPFLCEQLPFFSSAPRAAV